MGLLQKLAIPYLYLMTSSFNMQQIEEQLVKLIVDTLRPYDGSYEEKIYILREVAAFIIQRQKLKEDKR